MVFDGRLRLTDYNREACAPGVIEQLTQCYRSVCCRSSRPAATDRARWPSDFPAARISQAALDALVSRIKS